MRILLLTTSFSVNASDRNLTNDLVDALAEQGHFVQVVLLDWGPSPPGEVKRFSMGELVDVLVVPPISVKGRETAFYRAFKWAVSSLRGRQAMNRALKGQSFDLFVGFSPATVTLAQNLLAHRISRRSYMILWDFFPYHHRSLGLIRSPSVFRVARYLENRLIGKFDVVGCMTRANIAYLESRYRIGPGVKTEILPIWGPTTQAEPASRAELRAEFDLPADKKIVVFGGVLSEGRGLEDIIAAAEYAYDAYPDLEFLIIGDGRLARMVIDRAARGGARLHYRRRVPRERYLTLLTACDGGLVCTVRDVDVPTFPSKTIDYLRAGVPIIASVEASTDYGDFIVANGLGSACLAGDAKALAETAWRVVSDTELTADMPARARACLLNIFDVRKIARRIIDSAGGNGAG